MDRINHPEIARYPPAGLHVGRIAEKFPALVGHPHIVIAVSQYRPYLRCRHIVSGKGRWSYDFDPRSDDRHPLQSPLCRGHPQHPGTVHLKARHTVHEPAVRLSLDIVQRDYPVILPVIPAESVTVHLYPCRPFVFHHTGQGIRIIRCDIAGMLIPPEPVLHTVI